MTEYRGERPCILWPPFLMRLARYGYFDQPRFRSKNPTAYSERYKHNP